MKTQTWVTPANSHHLPAMMTEALCVGFFPILILYWFISSSICWSLCMASRQFLRLFFFTVLHSSGSLASLLAASTIFCCSANLLSRFLRKGSCSGQQRQQAFRTAPSHAGENCHLTSASASLLQKLKQKWASWKQTAVTNAVAGSDFHPTSALANICLQLSCWLLETIRLGLDGYGPSYHKI